MADLDETPPDLRLLELISDPVRFRLVQRLISGPATQKELALELSLNSGTLSKQMTMLREAGFVGRARPHAPYELRFRTGVIRLLQATLNLQQEILDTRLANNAAAQERLSKSILRSSAAVESETG